MALQPRRYAGTIPEIAEAYKNDPRTLLSNSMLATGSSTAPVAQGGWAVTDGLARAAQAIAGAYFSKQNQKKFAEREADYTNTLRDAAQMASMPQAQPAAVNPATLNPATQQAAAALAPPQAPPPMVGTSGQGLPRPIQSFDPGASSAEQAPALATAAQALAPPQAPAPVPPANYAPASVPLSAPRPTTGGTGPNRGARTQLSSRDLFMNGIVAIEGGTDAQGRFLTSPDGAIGPAQVMPGTAPEAAKLAGLPFDEQRYRTDPQYNLELGHAYFAKQLETFGDPLKAAAAYNAGPGAVRRAVRRANKDGGEWTDYLPVDKNDNTRNYVNSFAQKVGAASGSSGGSAVSAVGATQVAPPTMEEVPAAPQAPTMADRPKPFDLPAEVQSSRIAMAQRMLQSGNPDMVQIAQKYLDQGLTEQNAARTLRAEQQFDRDVTDFQYGMQDFNDARSSSRQFGYDSNRDAQQRNFSRETGFREQSFEAAENAASREQQARFANQQHFWQTQEAEVQRAWQSKENEADRASTSRGGSTRNPLLDTASGLKIMKDMDAERDTNSAVMSSVDRFLQLNERQQTGGWVLGSEVGRSFVGMTDAEVKEMTALANEIVIGKLGGLGVAISDGDRNFVSQSMVSGGSPRTTNINRGNIIKGVLSRRNDYIYNWQLAQAEGRPTDFMRSWKLYIDSTPVVKRGENGTVAFNPMTYEQWAASRPRYDANGNKVN